MRAHLAAPGLAAADQRRVIRALAEVKQARGEVPARLAQLGSAQAEMIAGGYGPGLLAEDRELDPLKEEAEAVRLFTELRDRHGSEKLAGGSVTYGQLAASALREVRDLAVGKDAPDIVGEDADGVPFKLSLASAARHGIRPVVEAFPMAEADRALGHIRRGKARYRAVLVA